MGTRGGRRKRWYEDLEPGDKLPPDYAFAQQEIVGRWKWTADSYLWVPTRVIYERYKDRWEKRPSPYPGDPDARLLTPQEFGIALRVAFPESVPTKRKHDGKQIAGLANLEGPGGLRSPWEDEAWQRRIKVR